MHQPLVFRLNARVNSSISETIFSFHLYRTSYQFQQCPCCICRFFALLLLLFSQLCANWPFTTNPVNPVNIATFKCNIHSLHGTYWTPTHGYRHFHSRGLLPYASFSRSICLTVCESYMHSIHTSTTSSMNIGVCLHVCVYVLFSLLLSCPKLWRKNKLSLAYR